MRNSERISSSFFNERVRKSSLPFNFPPRMRRTAKVTIAPVLDQAM